jgi:GTPase SAR1 family protein
MCEEGRANVPSLRRVRPFGSSSATQSVALNRGAEAPGQLRPHVACCEELGGHAGVIESRAMRLAFSGSHGVGKTTLVAWLSDYFQANGKSVTVIGGISRALALRGVNIDVHSRTEDHYFYVAEYARQLLDAGGEIVINDRTLLDAYAYMRENEAPSRGFAEMMQQLMRWYVRDVDFYFYVPVEFPLIGDGIRSTDVGYQAVVDRAIQSLLVELRVRFVLVGGSLDDRKRTVMDTIKNTR